MRKTIFSLCFAALLGGIAGIQSCKKEENKAPSLTIAEPMDGDVILLPDSVHIEGVASDDNELHEMSIMIKNHMDSTVYTSYPYVHDQKSYDFHQHFITTDTGMYHLTISAADHDDAVTTKTVDFYVR